jgi:uncharacterized membrane protein YsdA (DUF1294 family)
LQAVDARLTTVALESIAEMSRGGSRTLVFALCFIVLICLFAWKGYLPWFIPGIYAFSSLFAFLFYSFDKAAAQANQWRICESTLHGLSLIGGWPGALVGQAVYRHKTRKASFRSGFWATVLANCSALAVAAILASKT